MGEIARIHDQVSRSYRGQAWHGPSLMEALQGVDATLASQRAGPAHSIWELVLHIAAWEAIATRTLVGAVYPDFPAMPPEEDWPAPSGAWHDALAHLDHAQNELEAAVISLPESRLDARVNGNRGFTYYYLVHGVVQHNLYHAGQISILKKLNQ